MIMNFFKLTLFDVGFRSLKELSSVQSEAVRGLITQPLTRLFMNSSARRRFITMCSWSNDAGAVFSCCCHVLDWRELPIICIPCLFLTSLISWFVLHVCITVLKISETLDLMCKISMNVVQLYVKLLIISFIYIMICLLSYRFNPVTIAGTAFTKLICAHLI